jgi:hypothetical protein
LFASPAASTINAHPDGLDHQGGTPTELGFQVTSAPWKAASSPFVGLVLPSRHPGSCLCQVFRGHRAGAGRGSRAVDVPAAMLLFPRAAVAGMVLLRLRLLGSCTCLVANALGLPSSNTPPTSRIFVET